MLQIIKDPFYNQTTYLAQNSLSGAPGDHDLFISSLGLLHGKQGFEYRSVSGHYVAHMVQKGSGTYTVDGKKYIKKAGDLFFTFPGARVHCVDNERDGELLEYMWTYLLGSRVDWALKQAGVSRENCHLVGRAGEDIHKLWGELLQHFVARRSDAVYCISWAWRFIRMLMPKAVRPLAGPDKTGHVARVLDYVLHSIMLRSITVAGLAEMLKMDRTTLFRFFKNEYGVAPKTYIDAARLDQAADLLKNTVLRVNEVCEQVGFKDPCYFSRVFREHYGAPPGAWRKNNSADIVKKFPR